MTSEIVRGGATRVTGAEASAAAFAAASSGLGAETLAASNSSCFGRAAIIVLRTQALTFGVARSRQASRFPPPRMQSITIGLPTLARQFSMAWLSSKATAILIGANNTSTATKVAFAIGFIDLISEPHWPAGNKCIKRNAMVDSNRDMYQVKCGYDGTDR